MSTNFFKENKYVVIKNAINKDVAGFIFNYFNIKKNAVSIMKKYKYLSPSNVDWGTFEDEQVPDSYAHYGDMAMETLLVMLQEKVETVTDLKLIPTYSYARMYKKGNELKKHKDRFSCEISTTLNLGGDLWPIFVEPNKNIGTITQNGYIPGNSNGLKIELEQGDMLVYSGCELEHWREPFEGEECGQVFLHYNNTETYNSYLNKFDTRPYVGLPGWFKNKKI